jgi:acyl-CoA thioester hydrolase
VRRRLRSDQEAIGEPVDVSLRVRYAETDKMGIVYHANYFVWFEIGRTELVRQRSIPYSEMEQEEDCHIVVANATCTFRAPARYDDVLTVRTRLRDVRSRVIVFAYEVLTEDGRLLAEGETTHVVTDGRGKPRALPDHFRQALTAPTPF